MSDPEIKSGPADAASMPLVEIPVTAEDVEREQNKRLMKWLAVVLLAILAGGTVYQRLSSPHNARDAFDAGMRLLKSTRYDQAILNFNRAVELQPNFADAYRMRGRAYVAQSNPDLAIRDFSHVAELQPHDAQALTERGFAHLDKKEYAAAVADADHAIAQDPTLGRAYNLRATARRSQGGLQPALDDFTRAVQLEPNLDNYFQRAATYQQMGEHQLAIADFGRALEEDPQSPHSYFARAESRAAVGDSAGARADISAGRKIDGW